MIVDLLRAFWDVFCTSPLAALGLLWGACYAVLSRMAKALKLAPWVPYAGLAGVAYLLYKKRRPWYAVALVVGMWALVLLASPKIRVALGVALPVGCGFGMLVHLASNYPTLPPWTAFQAMMIDRRQREVLGDAVPVSAGEGARLVKDSVHVAADGSFEAEIIGPPGMSHADLLDALRSTLAETVYAMSGRRVEHMAVSGSGGVKGRVKVRGSAVSPYQKTVSLEDL